MGPRKKNTRAAQLNPQPTTASDYDTDNLTDATASAMAAPPVRSNNELNLLVLRRYVPQIDNIISIAPFAVVYLFSPESQGWEKCGIEGTLFVCQLHTPHPGGHPRYNVVILNRKSLDNFVTELVSGEDIEITEEYVILQVVGEDGTPNIYGLWIFSDDQEQVNTREAVANAIQECAMRVEQGREMGGENGHGQEQAFGMDGAMDAPEEAAPAPMQPPDGGKQIDLMTLFGKSGGSGSVPQAQHQAPMQPPQQPTQPARFSATADNDFFRASNSPATVVEQQAQPPTQQNVLLDLFKSAKNG